MSCLLNDVLLFTGGMQCRSFREEVFLRSFLLPVRPIADKLELTSMQQGQASEGEDLPLLQSEDELAAPQEHSDHQQTAPNEPLVQTVDGQHMQPADAQRLSKQSEPDCP